MAERICCSRRVTAAVTVVVGLGTVVTASLAVGPALSGVGTALLAFLSAAPELLRLAGDRLERHLGGAA